MKTLPSDATDQEIKALVVEWSELLAEERYHEALDLAPSSEIEGSWTAALLKDAINGYGVPEVPPALNEALLKRHGVEEFRVTTLVGRPDHEEIVREKIVVERGPVYDMDPATYVGVIHYDDVPLSGFRSDLTARFFIKLAGPDRIALEFLDLHVM